MWNCFCYCYSAIDIVRSFSMCNRRQGRSSQVSQLHVAKAAGGKGLLETLDGLNLSNSTNLLNIPSAGILLKKDISYSWSRLSRHMLKIINCSCHLLSLMTARAVGCCAVCVCVCLETIYLFTRETFASGSNEKFPSLLFPLRPPIPSPPLDRKREIISSRSLPQYGSEDFNL